MIFPLSYEVLRAVLSERELDLIRRMGRGQCPKEIAQDLGVHRSRVYQRIRALTEKLRMSPREVERFGQALVNDHR